MTKQAWLDLNVEQDERYLVEAIRQKLLTPDQQAKMAALDISIEDAINGRAPLNLEGFIFGLFEDWNATLGFCYFGDCD